MEKSNRFKIENVAALKGLHEYQEVVMNPMYASDCVHWIFSALILSITFSMLYNLHMTNVMLFITLVISA